MRDQLTWDKSTRTMLINGQPSTRKRRQRGFNPVRRRRVGAKRLKQAEQERIRESLRLQGYTDAAKIEQLVYLQTCSHQQFMKAIREWQKQFKCGGRHIYHRWDGGICRRCNAVSPALVAKRKRWRASKLKELGL